jgi:uncharacterized membrane protein
MPLFYLLLLIFLVSLAAGAVAYILARQCGAARFAISKRSANAIFLLLVLLYTLVFGTLSILQQVSFYGTGFDLAQYDQLIWNSLHGRLLENSLIPDASFYLGKSFSPILLALVPLYAVWANPLVLVTLQTLAIVATAFPLYWLARERIGNSLALVVIAAFFLSPVVQFLNMTQFYEITLTTPLLAFAIFFLLRRHDKGFLVSLALALLVKEEVALITVVFGIFVAIVQRRWRFGFGLAAFGAVSTVLLLQFVIPYFRGNAYGTTFYYFGQGKVGSAGERYAYLGHSILEIMQTVLTRPDIILRHVIIPGKLEFLLELFVPLGFVPLAGLDVLLLTLSTFGYTLLSDYEFQFSIQHAYTAPLLPLIFSALIVGVQRLLNTKDHSARGVGLGTLILFASVLSFFSQAPAPFAANWNPVRYTPTPHTWLGYSLMNVIPADAAVVAQTEFVSNLSQRRQIYEFPSIADYRQADYLFADQQRYWYSFHRGSWERWLASGYFEIVAQEDGYIVARRRVVAPTLQLRYGDTLTLLGAMPVITETWRGGMTVRPIVTWRAEKPISVRDEMLIQVLDAQGHVWAQEDEEPQDGNLPTNQWQVDRTIGDQYMLALPPTMPAGNYRVTIGVHRAGTGSYLDAADATGKPLGNQPVIATVKVEKDKSSYTASDLVKLQPMTAYFVDMGEMRFLGYVPPLKSAKVGGSFSLGIYWRAREKPRGDYVVAVQLRDQSGRIAFEQASHPAKGTYPTTEWDAGEVLLDWHDFHLPIDIAPGEYQIFVVLRDSGSDRVLGQTAVSSLTINR